MATTGVIDRPVRDIMTEEVYRIEADKDLPEAQKIFARHKIRHLPVVRNDHLVGILSLTDLQRLSFADSFGDYETEVDDTIAEMLSIEQVMKHKPVTVSPDATIKEVAEILTGAEFHALPVVENDVLVGIVTTTDIISYLLKEVKSR